MTFDLLIIGGGINGAGIARDAAMRGLTVCLVEQEDWCYGTSSRSSMLAHGGLRYLEQFELGLVHEALQDREIMFRQAPHLVRPLQFLYPLYPHIASRRTVRVGLWLYDVLSHGKSVPKRDYLRRDDVVTALPGIRKKDLIGGATYYDGQWTSVERFVQELVASAREAGAICIPQARVVALETTAKGHRVNLAVTTPESASIAAPHGRSADGQVTVEARAVINAAGPWVDELVADTGAPRLIRGTKGSHIVIPRFVDTALIIRANDGRTFFIIPWHEHCVIGTTDLDYEGDPGDIAATAEEVQYLQDSVRWYFPKAPVDDIRWTYAGVRPLVRQEGLTEGNVTRRHLLHDHGPEGHPRLWSVQGGKLTTYRHLAEEAVDAVARALDRPTDHVTRTGYLPGGVPDWPAFREQAIQEARDRGYDEASATYLVDTYGGRWEHVADHESTPRPISHGVTLAAIRHAVECEQGHRLRDVMLRRTRLGLGDGDPTATKRVASEMGAMLGWDAKRKRAEVAAYRSELRRLQTAKA